ncbi:MAG: undecaprenyl-diphosphate phosphatase [Candidatus Bathyarchaeota archaeon]|nr:MAG: undecaprenyl-diphosphate phosphatase [Candidatus Bathyarchaeota archaeon]
MPILIEAILLGIIQGLTEWLPVSSSGHLAIIQLLLGIKTGLLFDILLHVGTLSVIIVRFRDDILQTTHEIVKGNIDNEAARRGIFVLSGCIPTALIGFAFYEPFRASFENPLVIGTAFATSGLALHLSQNLGTNEKRRLEFSDSVLLGIAQGVSIVPGISRSGLTISTAILIGLDKEEAFRYSFLLSIPAVLGASFFEAARQPLTQIDWNVSLVGLLTAIIVGYASISLLWRFMQRNQFHYFKYYCWSVGCITAILSIIGLT